MELKEYLKIFKDNFKLFAFVVVIVVLGTFAYFTFKPVSYSASLALNITRIGSQKETTDYRYDDFYRLQADEKFAETVVEWLKNPRTAADILAKANVDATHLSLRKLSNVFVAEKLSSQIVAVSFSASNERSAKKISDAVLEIISKNTEALNKNQNEVTWFEVVAQSPVIIQDKVSPTILLLASLAMGMFLGFWIVLIKHYLK
jgi:capsular polysaccharide biosynthesis protein